jgi:hypothetical protein
MQVCYDFTMRKETPRLPYWAERALQGLVFWIGHRHALYRDYPLFEGALVAETCNLIYANFRCREVLHCEEQYSGLVPPDRRRQFTEQKPRPRADLVVTAQPDTGQAGKSADLLFKAEAVIEVKRSSAGQREIDKDLKRLAKLKVANSKLRTFLFVVSEAGKAGRAIMWKRFVSKNTGKAIRRETKIPGTSCHYCVRRVLKAAASFGGYKSAHYACIIEVLSK